MKQFVPYESLLSLDYGCCKRTRIALDPFIGPSVEMIVDTLKKSVSILGSVSELIAQYASPWSKNLQIVSDEDQFRAQHVTRVHIIAQVECDRPSICRLQDMYTWTYSPDTTTKVCEEFPYTFNFPQNYDDHVRDQLKVGPGWIALIYGNCKQREVLIIPENQFPDAMKHAIQMEGKECRDVTIPGDTFRTKLFVDIKDFVALQEKSSRGEGQPPQLPPFSRKTWFSMGRFSPLQVPIQVGVLRASDKSRVVLIM